MPKFEWLESFELGVPEIDGDHRTMLELMKAVQKTAADGARERCEGIVERLLDFTKVHFAREENLLREWGYDQAGTHARYHNDLLKRAENVRRACTQIETDEGYEDCCEEIMTFLIDDVLHGDIGLKAFVKESGLAVGV